MAFISYHKSKFLHRECKKASDKSTEVEFHIKPKSTIHLKKIKTETINFLLSPLRAYYSRIQHTCSQDLTRKSECTNRN